MIKSPTNEDKEYILSKIISLKDQHYSNSLSAISVEDDIDAFILVNKECHSSAHFPDAHKSVIDFWKQHSFHITAIYSNEPSVNPNIHLKECLDFITRKILKVGDILWAYSSEYPSDIMEQLDFIPSNDLWFTQIE